MPTVIRDGALKIERYEAQRSSHRVCEEVCTRSGRFRVTIAGWRYGILCVVHVRQLERLWDSALGVEEKAA